MHLITFMQGKWATYLESTSNWFHDLESWTWENRGFVKNCPSVGVILSWWTAAETWFDVCVMHDRITNNNLILSKVYFFHWIHSMRSTPLSISKCDSNEALSTESRRWLGNLAIVSICFCFRWLIFLFFFSAEKLEVCDSIIRKLWPHPVLLDEH